MLYQFIIIITLVFSVQANLSVANTKHLQNESDIVDNETSQDKNKTLEENIIAERIVEPNKYLTFETDSNSENVTLTSVPSTEASVSKSMHQDILSTVNDGLPDATAYVGRIFEYSLADNSIFGNPENRIEVKKAIDDQLPSWLLYDSNRRRLIGVPSQSDIGEVYISVKTICLPTLPCFKDVFLLTVQKSDYGFKNNDPQSVVTSSSSPTNNEMHGCENEVVITNIVFCITSDKLSSSTRLKMLSDMSQFLSIPEKNLMLLSSSGQKLRALEDGFQIVSAGPGNAGFCDEDSNIELSWEISCSTLKNLADFVAILQHNIEVGRIQKESGVGVVGWYIASSNSFLTSLHKRRRRRAWRTPVPTPVVSPATPTRVDTTSTIIPTTSFISDLRYTSYKPGLPTIEITIRSTGSSHGSTRTYGFIQPTKTEGLPSLTPYQSKTFITDQLTGSKTSQPPKEPYESEYFRPSKATPEPSMSFYSGAPGIESPLYTETTSKSTSYDLESTRIESSTNIGSDDIHHTVTSTPALSSTSLHMETQPTTHQLSSSSLKTTVAITSEWTKQTSLEKQSISATIEVYANLTSISPSESTVHEGSATDMIDSSEGSASGDKIDEGSEGSASGSGAAAIDGDDEDDLTSSHRWVEASSSFIPSFSSVVFLPHPDEGGITFEHPTDIFPVSDVTENSVKYAQSISPKPTAEIMLSSGILNPTKHPAVPVEEAEEGTTGFMKTTEDSGSLETIFDENVSTFSGHGPIDDHTGKASTIRPISERTTSNTSQNVIIEEPETTTSQMSERVTKKLADVGDWKSTRFATTTTTKATTTAATTTEITTQKKIESSSFKDSLTTGFMKADKTTWLTTPKPISRKDTTTFGSRGRTDWGTATNVVFSRDFTTSRPTTRQWFSMTEATTPFIMKMTDASTSGRSSTEFSWVTQRQHNKGKKKDKKEKKKKNKHKDRKKNRKNRTSTVDYWKWKTLPYDHSTVPSVTKWPSLPAEPNQKPYLENSIDYIDATLGEYFEFPIPRNVFYDIEDGDTRALELSLTLPYDQPLPPTFWLQLDSRRQVIRGLPLAVDLDTGYTSVNLIARDTGGLTEIDSIKINVNSSFFGKFTHKFIMRFGVDFARFMNDRTNLNHLLRLIAGYFGDSDVNNITVMDIAVGSLLLTWTNNTLSGDKCNNETITQLYGKMVRRDGSIRTALNRHFGKNLPIQELEFQPYGACSEFQTTASYSTTTFRSEAAEDTGLSIWAQVVLPVMVSLLVILLIVLLILLINRRRKKKQQPTTWDKPVFNNDRHPVIFPDELEREEPKPKKTGTLNSDGSLSSGASRNSRPFYYFEDDPESNDSTLNSERSRTGSNKRPPKAPPPYWQPHSEPPPYRLPPPYAPQQTNV